VLPTPAQGLWGRLYVAELAAARPRGPARCSRGPLETTLTCPLGGLCVACIGVCEQARPGDLSREGCGERSDGAMQLQRRAQP